MLRPPRATAETLLDKLKQLHQDDVFFVTSSSADGTFVIQHFAGRVKYHIQVGCNSQKANVFVVRMQSYYFTSYYRTLRL